MLLRDAMTSGWSTDAFLIDMKRDELVDRFILFDEPITCWDHFN